MIMPLIPGNYRADENGQVSYVRNYPEWMGPVDEDYYYECLRIGWEYAAKQFAGKVEYWKQQMSTITSISEAFLPMSKM